LLTLIVLTALVKITKREDFLEVAAYSYLAVSRFFRYLVLIVVCDMMVFVQISDQMVGRVPVK